MAADASSLTPPATLTVDPAGIPADLRALPHWVVWRWQPRDGHWRKPPLRADGRGDAFSNDARTWASCDEALAAYRQRRLDGIGFAVAADDPFFFVDLDDCREPLTGEVAPWAAPILDRFQHTYQEVSPSATGFKILGRGTPPVDRLVYPIAGARPRANVEVFASVKYTTLTGHRLPGTPSAVSDVQVALDGLYAELVPNGPAGDQAPLPAPGADRDDAAWLERARHARNGVDFCRLFDAGDLSAYEHDREQGMLALVAMLAAWLGPDRAGIDRAFRRSALMHEGWDQSPGGDGRTRGDRIIDAALSGWPDGLPPRGSGR